MAGEAGVFPGGEFARIPLRDGGFLAVTLYLPVGARTGVAAPCLLEALPYRKDDLTSSYRPEYLRLRDEHGYAVARVDLRGTGSSPGIMLDEYHPSEQADLVEAIAWLAAQPWCTGAVGMFGTSWSGFNSLQLACERPPALKAIVATYASDDRWTDDVHYCGGALRWLDQIDYPLYMVAMAGLPPVPALFGEGWREEWLRRAGETPPWLLGWLEAPTDGPAWRQGSVRPSYARIGCPTMLVTGWADGYCNIGFRAFEALVAAGTPVHVLAGPWSHQSPETAVPGPTVDHVPVLARWWDRWLRETPNGVDAQPPFTVFVRGYAAPEPDAPVWPGRWEAHDRATLAARTELVLPLTSGRVGGGVRSGDVVGYAGDPDVGLAGWNSCAGSLPWGQPLDQTPDDARSLLVEWGVQAAEASVGAAAVVLGHPRLRLRVRPEAEVAFVSAKLSLTPESGRPSLLVSRGLLDLAYREGLDRPPQPCTPGEWVDVELELDACAFEPSSAGAGGRLRLALACADWPNVVAPPGLWSAVDLAASALVLPLSAGTPHPAPDLPTPVPAAPEPAPADVQAVEETSHVDWRFGYDVLTRTTSADVDHGSSYRGNLGVRCTEHYLGHVDVDRRTAGQTATATCSYTLSWPPGDGVDAVTVTSRARLVLTADARAFDVRVDLEVTDGEQVVVERRWERHLPRRLA